MTRRGLHNNVHYNIYKTAATIILMMSMLNIVYFDRSVADMMKAEKNVEVVESESEAWSHQSPEYQPSSAEQYILKNADRLGFNSSDDPATCHIWKNPQATSPEVFNSLIAYTKDIARYNKLIKKFKPIPSIMGKLRRGGVSSREICDSLRLHPSGLQGIFPSKQLSLTSSGYVEPLLPPMRSHKICDNMGNLLSLDYLVHDFEFMCRKLKSSSRLILVDMGASLNFGDQVSPLISLLKQYETFGFVFDHIYGFEAKKEDPNVVYNTLLPEEYIPSYHWVNVGVSAGEGDKLNPLHSIVKKFNEDDFVVVKLDIDTSSIEVPLFLQLIEDKDGVYTKIIDQFYFEHHVHLGELAPSWGVHTNGTVGESLEYFSLLREKGIPAHFWP